MTIDSIKERERHYKANWQAWIALRHFLPVPVLREMLSVVVEELSGNEFTIDSLFEQILTPGPITLATWVLYPKDTESTLGRYLQSHIKAIVWQHDLSGYDLIGDIKIDESIHEWILDVAINVGNQDLVSISTIDDELPSSRQESLFALVSALKVASSLDSDGESRNLVEEIDELVENIEMPLKAFVMKHIGDMCVDSNYWIHANKLYRNTHELVTAWENDLWSDLKQILETIITQSIAAATKVLNGGREASEQLTNAFTKSAFNQNPMLYANASFDAFSAQFSTEDMRVVFKGARTALMYPSMLIHTHDVSMALAKSHTDDYRGSSRCFWAALRRQVALGSSAGINQIKMLYSTSILNQLESSQENQNQQYLFELATKLLIESGHVKSVDGMAWDKLHVNECMSMGLLVNIIDNDIDVYKGVFKQRKLVIIGLFKAWINQINVEKLKEVSTMYSYIVDQTSIGVAFNSAFNVTGVAYDALTSIAKTRPEFRNIIADKIVSSFSNTLQEKTIWQAYSVALETILSYIDIISKEQQIIVLQQTLGLLTRIKPEAGLYPVVRPALNVLVDKNVKAAVESGSDLEKQVVEKILHFGLHQDSEYTRVFLYLHDYSKKILERVEVRDQLEDNITKVLKNTERINRSSVVDDITAILITTRIFGYEGLRIAVIAIMRILNSIIKPNSSSQFVFSESYNLILTLCRKHTEIIEEIGDKKEQYAQLLTRLTKRIIAVWKHAASEPSIFSSISFTANPKPNQIIVHNWAFASQQLAILLGMEEELSIALKIASKNTELVKEIIQARESTRMSAKWINVDDYIEEICSSNASTFYSTIGKRLVVLHRANGEDTKRLSRALVEKCILLGPMEIDAAILISAYTNEVIDYRMDLEDTDYVRRLMNNKEIRVLLLPIIQMIKSRSSYEQI